MTFRVFKWNEAVKHTPGPWYWEKARTLLHLQSESEGSLGISVKRDIDERRCANLNLIAAAPDLLQCCELAASKLAYYLETDQEADPKYGRYGPSRPLRHLKETVRLLSKVISKANGEK